MIAALVNPISDRQAAEASLMTFMRLPVTQRSCVILMDVLGYSLQEISKVTGTSLPAVKAALNRGRRRLRELAKEPEDLSMPVLTEPERSLLAGYVDRFNARDFDALRAQLADDARLDLAGRHRVEGKARVAKDMVNMEEIHEKENERKALEQNALAEFLASQGIQTTGATGAATPAGEKQIGPT